MTTVHIKTVLSEKRSTVTRRAMKKMKILKEEMKEMSTRAQKQLCNGIKTPTIETKGGSA